MASAPGAGTWQVIDLADLPEWVELCMQGNHPPIYELADEAPDLDVGTDSFRESGFAPPELHRRADSGLWRVRIASDPGKRLEAAQALFLQRIRDAAERLDNRQLVATDRPRSSVVASVARSRLQEHNLPVLGPGGCLTVYSLADALQVDVVFRKRRRPVPSQWRSRDEIVAGIRSRISALGSDLQAAKVQGSLGYFELSKYERQAYLRPVLVLHMDFLSPNDATILWRSTVVEAATTAVDVALAEGLGSWAA